MLIVAATTSGNLFGAGGPRWWDRAINALVPAALIAAMIAHALPFIVPGQGLYPIDLNTGFSAFFIGFLVLTAAPLDPFFEAFWDAKVEAAFGPASASQELLSRYRKIW